MKEVYEFIITLITACFKSWDHGHIGPLKQKSQGAQASVPLFPMPVWETAQSKLKHFCIVKF